VLEPPSENRSPGAAASSPPPSSKRSIIKKEKKAAALAKAALPALPEPAAAFPFGERMSAMEERLEAIDGNFSLILRAVGNLEALMTRQAMATHAATPYLGSDAATPAVTPFSRLPHGQPSCTPPASISATASQVPPPDVSPVPTDGFTLRGFVNSFGTPTGKATGKSPGKSDDLAA